MIFSSKKRIQSGFTLIEVLVVVAISGMLMLSLSNVIGEVSNTQTSIKESNDLNREAAFVMRRLVQLISRASSIVEITNSATEIHFNLIPDPERDIDKDGYADSDNDKDGKVDEDPSGDMNSDGKAGIKGKDDDDDGLIDEGDKNDDDEDGLENEDKPEDLYIQWKDGIFKETDLMPYDVNGDVDIDELDTVEYTLSEKITRFTVVYTTSSRYPLFDVTLVFSDALGNQVTLATKIRVGGRL